MQASSLHAQGMLLACNGRFFASSPPAAVAPASAHQTLHCRLLRLLPPSGSRCCCAATASSGAPLLPLPEHAKHTVPPLPAQAGHGCGSFCGEGTRRQACLAAVGSSGKGTASPAHARPATASSPGLAACLREADAQCRHAGCGHRAANNDFLEYGGVGHRWAASPGGGGWLPGLQLAATGRAWACLSCCALHVWDASWGWSACGRKWGVRAPGVGGFWRSAVTCTSGHSPVHTGSAAMPVLGGLSRRRGRSTPAAPMQAPSSFSGVDRPGLRTTSQLEGSSRVSARPAAQAERYDRRCSSWALRHLPERSRESAASQLQPRQRCGSPHLAGGGGGSAAWQRRQQPPRSPWQGPAAGACDSVQCLRTSQMFVISRVHQPSRCSMPQHPRRCHAGACRGGTALPLRGHISGRDASGRSGPGRPHLPHLHRPRCAWGLHMLRGWVQGCSRVAGVCSL